MARTHSIYEDTNPHDLKLLLAQIHAREAALPDFQRNFVWDPKATQELIVSIANNYPAGSLLRIRNTRNDFACREFQGAPHLAKHSPIYLFLDGQQRLTSLYQAFYGVGENRYFLNLNKLRTGAAFEDAIFHLKETNKDARSLINPESQYSELVMPLSVLQDGTGQFHAWSKRVLKHWRQRENEIDVDSLDEELDGIAEEWIQTIDDYRFPVVTLSDRTTAEAVCTIFETLNRTGVKLSVFELLTARFWPMKVDLRNLWDSARNAYPVLAEYEVEPFYVLQSISLLSTSPATCKRGDVLDLSARDIQNYWDDCVRSMAAGLEMLREDCGVLSKDWMPINPFLVPLAAFLARTEHSQGRQAGKTRLLVNQWFWCSALGSKYESGPNSQASKDFVEMCGWSTGGQAPESISTFRFDRALLRETTFRQRSLYRALMCIILSQRSRDFHTGAVMTSATLRSSNVDDHHVFPQAWLDKARSGQVPARLRDSILNRTLIDAVTNRQIGKKSPSTYLALISETIGDEALDEVLMSHLIPSGRTSPLFKDEFEAYIDQREEIIWAKLNELTGMADRNEMATHRSTS